MGVYEMGPFGSHPPVSEQKHFLDIKDAPSATCWSVLKGEPGRVPWALSPFGVTQPVPRLHRYLSPLSHRALPGSPLRSVTGAFLLVARPCWCLFVASRILQCFLPVTAPSTSAEDDVGHFLTYRRSELAGERRGP